MKRLTTILCVAALVAAAASCNKLAESENVKPLSENAEYAEVAFNVAVDGVEVLSRAATGAGDLAGQAYETQVNKVSIFVFNSDGSKLEAYKAITAKTTTMSLKTNVPYKVYALVNYNGTETLTNIQNETALKALAINLDKESRTAAKGFQMLSDATSKTFTSSDLTCNLTVSRIASRVRLVKVTNALPAAAGNLKINGVFLSNVVSNWALTAPAIVWINQQGRSDNTKTNYVTSSTAAAKEMTWQSPAADIATGGAFSTVQNLYCYANDSATAPSGWLATGYAGQHTMMILVAEIGAKTYYYPIDLNKRIAAGKIERNKTYDVSVVINNYGSEDEPNKEIETSTMTINVAVSEWTDGGTVDAAI